MPKPAAETITGTRLRAWRLATVSIGFTASGGIGTTLKVL